MRPGSIPGAVTCVGFSRQMSKLENTLDSGMWWSNGCAPCAAQLRPFQSLFCAGSISDRLLLNGRGGMVHRAPVLRTRQKFHLPQNVGILKMLGVPQHKLISALFNLPPGDLSVL